MKFFNNQKDTKPQKEEKKITEVKVDRKPVKVAMNVWNMALNIVGGLLAIIGAFSLVHPDLRLEVLSIFNQFIDEIELFF